MKFFLSILMTLSFSLSGYLQPGFASSLKEEQDSSKISSKKSASPQLSRSKAMTVPAKKSKAASPIIASSEDPFTFLLGSSSKSGNHSESHIKRVERSSRKKSDVPKNISEEDLKRIIEGKVVIFSKRRAQLSENSKAQATALENCDSFCAILNQIEPLPLGPLGARNSPKTIAAEYGVYEQAEPESPRRYMDIILQIEFSRSKEVPKTA